MLTWEIYCWFKVLRMAGLKSKHYSQVEFEGGKIDKLQRVCIITKKFVNCTRGLIVKHDIRCSKFFVQNLIYLETDIHLQIGFLKVRDEQIRVCSRVGNILLMYLEFKS